MPLQAPITLATHAALRAAVIELKETETRRSFPVVLHAGRPGGRAHAVPTGPGWDQGLRTDVAGALLMRARAHSPEAIAWLTRPGALVLHDADAAWSAAFTTAFAEAGMPHTFVAVTRAGWFDPVSGVRREWRRLRGRTATPPSG
jgi:hypothetical protein